MSKATAIAPANIALIKYWGKKNAALRLPENNSIAINQSNLYTTTTVEFSKKYKQDRFQLGITVDKSMRSHEFVNYNDKRVVEHLDRIRKLAGFDTKARVVSKNNFPTAAGLASSASGFAALTVAAAKAAGLDLAEKELSILARQGSGSACRSIPDGFVEWLAADTSKESYAYSLYPPDYWDITVLAVIVGAGEKKISTTKGHKLAKANPFLRTRLKNIGKKIDSIKKYMAEKNFQKFGELIEAEALELHAIMLASTPPLLYWLPATIRVMRNIQKWRREGLESYFTIDAGPHLHIICQDQQVEDLMAKLRKIDGVKGVILNKPAKGTHLSKNHLF